MGLGIGAGINAFSLLSDAVSTTVDVVGELIKAGIDEQASISHLGAALQANIPGWNGNTDAIERVIASQIKLGFSDEEQRASLSSLVAATHNVGEALEIQRTAMDLARFKGISLAEATDALTKVEAGSYRILKSLGIELKANATQQDALNAVQKVANGQALEYTRTVEGKLLVAQTQLGEEMDRLGAILLPAVAMGLGGVVSVLDTMATGFDNATDSSKDFGTRITGLLEATNQLNPSLAGLNLYMGYLKGEQDAAAASAQELAVAARSIAEGEAEGRDAIRDTTKEMQDQSASAADNAKDIAARADKIKSAFSGLAAWFLNDYTQTMDRAFTIEDARSGLSANRHEADALRKQIASGKLTGQALRDAQARMTALDKEDADHFAKLEASGAMSQADYTAWAATLTRLAKGTKGAVHDAYVAALHDIEALRSEAKKPIDIRVRYLVSGSNSNPQKLASGGRARGGATWVGEDGPELVDLPAGSYVYSNGESMQMARGTTSGSAPRGGDIHVHIDQGAYIDGPSIDRLTNLIAERLNYATGR